MKQILTIINDCRECPNYFFKETYPGGVVFICDIYLNLEDRLITRDVQNDNFIHEECTLNDYNGT